MTFTTHSLKHQSNSQYCTDYVTKICRKRRKMRGFWICNLFANNYRSKKLFNKVCDLTCICASDSGKIAHFVKQLFETVVVCKTNYRFRILAFFCVFCIFWSRNLCRIANGVDGWVNVSWISPATMCTTVNLTHRYLTICRREQGVTSQCQDGIFHSSVWCCVQRLTTGSSFTTFRC